MKTTTISFACAIIFTLGIAICPCPAHAQGAPTGPVKELPPPQPADGFKTARERASYAVGMNLGINFRAQSVDLDPDLLLQGLKDSMSGGKMLLTPEQARAALMQLQTDVRAKLEEKRKADSAKNKSEGAAFLATNKTKDGVVTLPSGLQYQILTAGTGAKPLPTDTVNCNYRGTLTSGVEFDSSEKHGGPAKFPVAGVIKGWTEALQLMPVGSKWRLFVPSELAYGAQGSGPSIGPDAVLIFEVELLSIEAKK